MKNIPLVVACLLLAISGRAQVADTSMRHLMVYREYDRFEVEYNAIQLAPQFYKRKSMDSLDALIGFWKIHCPANERLFSICVLNDIRNNTFRELVNENEFLTARVKSNSSDSDLYKSSIFAYLNEYKNAVCKGKLSEDQYDLWISENYPLPRNYTEYLVLYRTYYRLLQQMALDMEGKRAYSPAERYLLRFYAHPDSTDFRDLDSVAYAGSMIHGRYQAYKKYRDDITGVSSNMHIGLWMPMGNMAVLGSHPALGFGMGGRTEGVLFDWLFGLRMGEARNNYNVLKDSTLYNTRNFFSWYTGFDLGFKLFRTRLSELDVLTGFGYEEIQTLSTTIKDHKGEDLYISQSAKSFYAGGGLGYKFYVRHAYSKGKMRHNYFSLQAKYNYTNYLNRGGTSLTGNSVTVNLVYGGYSFKFSKFPYLEQ